MALVESGRFGAEVGPLNQSGVHTKNRRAICSSSPGQGECEAGQLG